MTNTEGFDINEVLRYLPHRYPFLMIDRVISYEVGKTLKAMKNVTINEPFFQGHFPHRPVMPGVMILEALAQASAILASTEYDARATEGRIYLFAGSDNVRFKRQVGPGDQLIFDVSMKRKVRSIWMCEGIARVGDEVACKADLMFTYQDVT